MVRIAHYEICLYGQYEYFGNYQKCIRMINYNGRVLTNFLIIDFGGSTVVDWVISSGHWFHTFFPSLMKLFIVPVECPLMIRSPLDIALDCLFKFEPFGTLFLNVLLFWSFFNAFHTSVILVWAFILFTESMFVFSNKDSVFMWSFNVTLFRNLTNLFWTFWQCLPSSSLAGLCQARVADRHVYGTDTRSNSRERRP